MSFVKVKATGAQSSLGTLGKTPKARLAALHMQVKNMRQPRSKNFPNARAERRPSLKARSTEKNKIEIWRKMLRHATVRGLE
jgi:hypothetical protein